MSSGDDIRVSYYSAVLARAIIQEDADLFTNLYDQIVPLVTKSEADLAVEKAREFSNLPLPTLQTKINWLESLGVKKLLPVKPAAVPPSISETTPTLLLIEEEVFYEESSMSENPGGNSFGGSGTSEPNYQKMYENTFHASPEERVEKYIDEEEGLEGRRGPLQQIVPGKTVFLDGGDDHSNVCQMLEEPEDSEGATLLSEHKEKMKKNISDEMEGDIVDFGLPGYQQRNKSSFSTYHESSNKKSYIEIEMNECAREIIPSHGNPVQVLQPMESQDSDDSSESNKKIKKKKKRKPKQQGVSEHLDCEASKQSVDEKVGKSSRNSRRKKFNEARKTTGSLECPEIKGPAIDCKPLVEEKPKKRTIKSFQEEKERQKEQHSFPLSANPKPDPLCGIEPKRSYGTTTKKAEEIKQDKHQLLNDETLNKILKDLGEETKIADPKKKFKDLKNAKKKNKKQKKIDKDFVKEKTHEETTCSVNMLGSKKTKIDEVVETLSAEEGEFVTQKKPRRCLNRTNQLLVDNSTQDVGVETVDNQNTRIHCAGVIHVYDRENEVQWPTLSATISGNAAQTTASSCVNQGSSYASKLKSNLDSTGCSLASSSEDGSSSSSSSSGGGVTSGGGGRLSPSNDVDFQLPDILSGVSSAVAATTKLMKSFGKFSSTSESPLPAIKPSCVNLKPAPIVEVAKRCDKHISVVVTKWNAAVTDNNKSLSACNHKCAVDGAANLLPSQNINQFPNDVVKIFENQWGLKFIMDNPKLVQENNVFDFSAAEKKSLKYIDDELTFECILDSTQEMKEKPMTVYNMRCRGNVEPWNDPGRFDVDGATTFLRSEWNQAFKHGEYYNGSTQ